MHILVLFGRRRRRLGPKGEVQPLRLILDLRRIWSHQVCLGQEQDNGLVRFDGYDLILPSSDAL